MCKFCDNIATVENRDPMAECQMYLVPVDESVALVVEHIMDDETSFFLEPWPTSASSADAA